MWSTGINVTSRSFLLIGHAESLQTKSLQQVFKLVSSISSTVSIRHASFLPKSRSAVYRLCEKPICNPTVTTVWQQRTLSSGHRPSVTGIHEHISALQSKKRAGRRRETSGTEGLKSVEGYTTAEEFNLESLLNGLTKQNLYAVRKLNGESQSDDPLGEVNEKESHPDVLHAVAKYVVEEEPREIFFFREGSVVFWNIREEEMANIFAFLKPYEHNSYDERLVLAEKEFMPYKHLESNQAKIQRGVIILPERSNLTLDKFTISNAISLSLKLGVWEASLESYIESIEFVTDDLKMGRKIRMSRDQVLRKHGELFALRHLINLSSDLLDTPDFYWEHEDLETIYQEAVAYFSIGRRTKVMNEKLNHCVELVELISSHLNDKHHVRLEWMIIVLIMVEVLFEIAHYCERFFSDTEEKCLSAWTADVT